MYTKYENLEIGGIYMDKGSRLVKVLNLLDYKYFTGVEVVEVTFDENDDLVEIGTPFQLKKHEVYKWEKY